MIFSLIILTICFVLVGISRKSDSKNQHMTLFVKKDIVPRLERGIPRIVVHASVKSGKREIAEYIAGRDQVQHEAQRIHAFLSAWHRVADEEQRFELATQNMTVFSITNKKAVEAFIKWITKKTQEGKYIVIHLDECDHGSGSKQMLSKVWPIIRNLKNTTTILYSATPEEVLLSGEVDDEEYNETIEDMINDGESVEYIPPEGYCGSSRFLREGLIHEAIPFFERVNDTYTLTSQGKEIVADLIRSTKSKSSRNIIVLRLSYSLLGGKKEDIKKNKAIYQFLSHIHSFPELSDCLIVVDKDDSTNIKNKRITVEKIPWSDRKWWRRQTSDIPIIVVIDQTCSRSTEWACHDRIFATHDFRNVVQYRTISQAQERVNHYEQKYGGFQPIHVYGHTRSFRLSAREIDYATFLKDDWKKKKIDARSSPEEMYRVLGTSTNKRHESCPEVGLTEIKADRLLQELGCYADISLSSRITGSVRTIRTYAGEWIAATKDTWNTIWPTYRDHLGAGETIRNPFIAAELHCLPDGTWKGQHRGWKILDYIEDTLYERISDTEYKKLDLGSTGGNRIKVCYKNGELGVCIVRYTGTRVIDTLHTFKSMYESKH